MGKSFIHGVNQQERLDSDIHWLAGIIDSEGCISAPKKHSVVLTIVNCNIDLLAEVGSILRENELPYAFYFHKAVVKGHRDSFTICTNRYVDSLRALRLVQPFLTGKREVCQLAMELSQNRLGKWGCPFTSKDKELIKAIANKNVRGIQNPQRLYVERIIPKIKSGLHGDMQSTAEMTVPSLAWLGGMIDGDGCVSMTKAQAGWCPRIVIANTDKIIIQCITNILAIRELPYYIGVKHRPPHKSLYSLEISGIKRCNKVLPIITPYLRTKKRQAILMQRFIDSRLKKGRGPRFTTSSAEHYMCERIRGLNTRGT